MSSRARKVKRAFDRDALTRVCEMHEDDFADVYNLEFVSVAPHQTYPDDFYLYRDNGSDILFVAHLDTVSPHAQRTCRFVDTAGGAVVYSRALDDRLGAYIGLHLLPELGLTFDVLLTVGEESGQSTASFFEIPEGKKYNWMIEFDRGGTDVVMYEYEDATLRDMVRGCGAQIGLGSFSDISYLEHLGIKGFNWGVGYRDYHGPRSHAYLDDTYNMVAKFLRFHQEWKDYAMPHEKKVSTWSKDYYWDSKEAKWTKSGSSAWAYDDDVWADEHEHDAALAAVDAYAAKHQHFDIDEYQEFEDSLTDEQLCDLDRGTLDENDLYEDWLRRKEEAEPELIIDGEVISDTMTHELAEAGIEVEGDALGAALAILSQRVEQRS